MRRVLVTSIWMALSLIPASPATAVISVGVGYSTVTSGRQIPALELGLDVNQWAINGMFAGARTKAYYTSGIMGAVLRKVDWGEFWFGRLEVGFGGGVYHGEKGIYTSTDEEGKLTSLEKDQDNAAGPVFRVAFKPITGIHISVEYLMGVGSSIFSNAWEDVGMGAIGVDL